jgi:quinol monooxygenase YgiN
MSSPILLTGTFDCDPDKRDILIEAAKAIMAITTKEAGCELYAITTDLADPGRLHISERWTDDESLAAHMKGAHLKDFGRAMRDTGAKAAITRWDGAEAKKLA